MLQKTSRNLCFGRKIKNNVMKNNFSKLNRNGQDLTVCIGCPLMRYLPVSQCSKNFDLSFFSTNSKLAYQLKFRAALWLVQLVVGSSKFPLHWLSDKLLHKGNLDDGSLLIAYWINGRGTGRNIIASFGWKLRLQNKYIVWNKCAGWHFMSHLQNYSIQMSHWYGRQRYILNQLSATSFPQ